MKIRHRPGGHAPFGSDRFGVAAERFARFFGTPRFIIGQTVVVALWIAANVAAVSLRWDPYPFILLNLMFSTQAAYAAPLILLAQTRQADRDAVQSQIDAQSHQAIVAAQAEALAEIQRASARIEELGELILEYEQRGERA